MYNYLCHLWPSYVSYIIGFLVIGVYWSNHHWLFTFINKTDHVFNMLNIVLLMSISFMPFTTAILGDFIVDDEYRNAAVTTYCIGYLIPIPIVFIVFLYAVYKHRLVPDNLNKTFINKMKIKLLSGFTLVLIALLLSFNYPLISICMIGICMLIYLFPPDKPVYDEEGLEEI